MSKFKPKLKIFNLSFEDPDYEGLNVRARSRTLGEILEVADQAESARSGAGISQVRELLELFVDSLESWNLTGQDDQDVPPTMEGLLGQEMDLALDIVLAWFDSMASVAGPLARGSTNGSKFQEASLPMVDL